MHTQRHNQRPVNCTGIRRRRARRLHSYSTCLLIGVLLFTACKKDKDPNACPKSVALKGKLVASSVPGQYSYTTSGGGHILINPGKQIVITHDNYPGFKVEFWGDATGLNGQVITSGNHENLNGKHIKDRVGSRRSFVFPDGAKITLVAGGEVEALISVSIYEGSESHRIGALCANVEHSSVDLPLTQQMDNAEADGETSTIEFITGGLLWVNIYKEDTPGNKVNSRVLLGELKSNNPNQVNDYYDDPRLGHT